MRPDVFMRLVTFLEPHVNDTFLPHGAHRICATLQPTIALLRVYNPKCVL